MSDNGNIFGDYISSDNVEENHEHLSASGGFQDELFPDIKTGSKKKDTDKEDDKTKKKPVDPEYEKLKNLSTHAQLYKHIQTEELNHLKIESEKIVFLKSAKTVAELSFMDFLYFGYMEKSNLDLLKMIKKLKHRYGTFLDDEKLNKVIDILSREIRYVLKAVKEKQKEDLEKWKDGLH